MITNFYEAEFASWLPFIILIAFMILFIVLSGNKIDKSRIHPLNKKDFMDTKRMGTLVDVRKKEEFDVGKITGAKNYPKKSGARDSRIRKDIPIFIYDTKGKKAYKIAKAYVKNGAVMVYYLAGGYEEYLNN